MGLGRVIGDSLNHFQLHSDLFLLAHDRLTALGVVNSWQKVMCCSSNFSTFLSEIHMFVAKIGCAHHVHSSLLSGSDQQLSLAFSKCIFISMS